MKNNRLKKYERKNVIKDTKKKKRINIRNVK